MKRVRMCSPGNSGSSPKGVDAVGLHSHNRPLQKLESPEGHMDTCCPGYKLAGLGQDTEAVEAVEKVLQGRGKKGEGRGHGVVSRIGWLLPLQRDWTGSSQHAGTASFRCRV